MDTGSIARITSLTESIIEDIRKWNDCRYDQRIKSGLQTIDVQVQEKAEVKVAELLGQEVQKSETLKRLQQERAKIERERVDHFQKFLFWSSVQLSGTFPALVIMALSGFVGCSLGVFIGLNALPSAVACPTVRSWCYFLRANKWTTLAPEIPVVEKDKQVTPLKKKTRRRF